MIRLFFLLAVCSAALLGFWYGSGVLPRKERMKAVAGIHPEKEFPVREYKSFVIALYAHNDAAWCERTLSSIFSQDYEHFRILFIDDGSRDDTYERVNDFVVANQQEHRVILMRNERQMGVGPSLQRIAGHCLDHEVVVPLRLSDWLTNQNVLAAVNGAFQNPDVWIVCGRTLCYPSYEFLELPDWKKGGYSDYEGLRAFYASLLREVSLTDFSLVPLLERSGGRVKNVLAPTLFRNQANT